MLVKKFILLISHLYIFLDNAQILVTYFYMSTKKKNLFWYIWKQLLAKQYSQNFLREPENFFILLFQKALKSNHIF